MDCLVGDWQGVLHVVQSKVGCEIAAVLLAAAAAAALVVWPTAGPFLMLAGSTPVIPCHF